MLNKISSDINNTNHVNDYNFDYNNFYENDHTHGYYNNTGNYDMQTAYDINQNHENHYNYCQQSNFHTNFNGNYNYYKVDEYSEQKLPTNMNTNYYTCDEKPAYEIPNYDQQYEVGNIAEKKPENFSYANDYDDYYKDYKYQEDFTNNSYYSNVVIENQRNSSCLHSGVDAKFSGSTTSNFYEYSEIYHNAIPQNDYQQNYYNWNSKPSFYQNDGTYYDQDTKESCEEQYANSTTDGDSRRNQNVTAQNIGNSGDCYVTQNITAYNTK